jgi:hypothetical protein
MQEEDLKKQPNRILQSLPCSLRVERYWKEDYLKASLLEMAGACSLSRVRLPVTRNQNKPRLALYRLTVEQMEPDTPRQESSQLGPHKG